MFFGCTARSIIILSTIGKRPEMCGRGQLITLTPVLNWYLFSNNTDRMNGKVNHHKILGLNMKKDENATMTCKQFCSHVTLIIIIIIK